MYVGAVWLQPVTQRAVGSRARDGRPPTRAHTAPCRRARGGSRRPRHDAATPRQRPTGPLVRPGPRCGLFGGRRDLLARLAERRPRRRRDADCGALGDEREAVGVIDRPDAVGPHAHVSRRPVGVGHDGRRTCRRHARRAPRSPRSSIHPAPRGRRFEVEQRAVRLGIELALGRPHRMSSQRRDSSRRQLRRRGSRAGPSRSPKPRARASPSGWGGRPGIVEVALRADHHAHGVERERSRERHRTRQAPRREMSLHRHHGGQELRGPARRECLQRDPTAVGQADDRDRTHRPVPLLDRRDRRAEALRAPRTKASTSPPPSRSVPKMSRATADVSGVRPSRTGRCTTGSPSRATCRPAPRGARGRDRSRGRPHALGCRA